eukprot:gene8411-14390_t
MARGQQKIQSQQKNAEKRAKSKKGTSQIKSAGAALVHSCPVCKSQMPDPKTYKQHFESKHPKVDLPEELKSKQLEKEKMKTVFLLLGYLKVNTVNKLIIYDLMNKKHLTLVLNMSLEVPPRFNKSYLLG